MPFPKVSNPHMSQHAYKVPSTQPCLVSYRSVLKLACFWTQKGNFSSLSSRHLQVLLVVRANKVIWQIQHTMQVCTIPHIPWKVWPNHEQWCHHLCCCLYHYHLLWWITFPLTIQSCVVTLKMWIWATKEVQGFCVQQGGKLDTKMMGMIKIVMKSMGTMRRLPSWSLIVNQQKEKYSLCMHLWTRRSWCAYLQGKFVSHIIC